VNTSRYTAIAIYFGSRTLTDRDFDRYRPDIAGRQLCSNLRFEGADRRSFVPDDKRNDGFPTGSETVSTGLLLPMSVVVGKKLTYDFEQAFSANNRIQDPVGLVDRYTSSAADQSREILAHKSRLGRGERARPRACPDCRSIAF